MKKLVTLHFKCSYDYISPGKIGLNRIFTPNVLILLRIPAVNSPHSSSSVLLLVQNIFVGRVLNILFSFFFIIISSVALFR